MRNALLCAIGVKVLFATPSSGKNVLQVEFSIPFATAAGKLIL
jgi:hypothetical protein